MAGDWIKWTYGLRSKPEVVRMAGLLNRSRNDVACLLMDLWEWCDANVPEEDIAEDKSVVIVLSPRDGDNMSFFDEQVSCPGFSAALAEVKWATFKDGGVHLPNFGRHNGKTAKTRARNSHNQKKKRGSKSDEDEDKGSRPVTGTRTLLSPRDGDILAPRGEREETRGQSKDIQSIGESRSHRSTRDFFDLKGVEWGQVLQWVESAAKRIPPRTPEDRRAWLKYGVMAWMQFSEDWIVGAADAVANTPGIKNRSAAFVSALRNRAKEKHEVEPDVFDGIFARIEIPKEIWKSGAVQVKG